MSNTPRYQTLRDYIRVLRHYRWLIVLATIVFAGAALAISLREKPKYQAEAAVALSDPFQDLDLFGTPVLPRQDPITRSTTAAEDVNQTSVVAATKKALKLPQPVSVLQSKLGSRVEVRTNFVIVQAEDGNAAFAAKLANGAAKQFAARFANEDRSRVRTLVRAAQQRLKTLSKTDPTQAITRGVTFERISRLQGLLAFAQPSQVVRSAATPATPVSPKPVRNALLGGLLGLTLGLIAAFMRDSLDRRLRGARDIQEQLELPLLGHVSSKAMGRAGLVTNGRRALADNDVEAFRILRTNLRFLDVDKPPRVLVVTSALPEEGKSTVAASLACTHAVAGARTLLVECDLRRPSLAKRLSLSQSPGLIDYLTGSVNPQEVLQTVELPDAPSGNGAGPDDAAGAQHGQLVCITAGGPAPRPAELLGSQRFKDFLEQVRSVYDVVLLDSSPLLSVADTLELLPHVDGVLVCVRAASTTRDQARAAKSTLDRFPARPTGLVVTDVRRGADEDYGFYSYSYAYGQRTPR